MENIHLEKEREMEHMENLNSQIGLYKDKITNINEGMQLHFARLHELNELIQGFPDNNVDTEKCLEHIEELKNIVRVLETETNDIRNFNSRQDELLECMKVCKARLDELHEHTNELAQMMLENDDDDDDNLDPDLVHNNGDYGGENDLDNDDDNDGDEDGDNDGDNVGDNDRDNDRDNDDENC